MMVLFMGVGGKDKNDGFIKNLDVCHNPQYINLNLHGKKSSWMLLGMVSTETYESMFKSLIICLLNTKLD